MQLPTARVFSHLLDCGVTRLHHANTVTTSCAFLERRELIARGVMEHIGLNQTSQESDENDRKRGVYFDVFLDTVDIHERASRRNVYGPVLFELSVEKLKEMKLPPLWVTKTNPMYWKSATPHEQRWFTSIDEFEEEFVVGRFEQMVVMRHIGGVLPIDECLEEVILDDPKLKYGKNDFFSLSFGALLLARANSGKKWKAKFIRRGCSAGCKCSKEYANDKDLTGTLFVPRRSLPGED